MKIAQGAKSIIDKAERWLDEYEPELGSYPSQLISSLAAELTRTLAEREERHHVGGFPSWVTQELIDALSGIISEGVAADATSNSIACICINAMIAALHPVPGPPAATDDTPLQALIDNCLMRARIAQHSLEHAAEEADGWFAGMPPEIAESWNEDVAFFSSIAVALSRHRTAEGFRWRIAELIDPATFAAQPTSDGHEIVLVQRTKAALAKADTIVALISGDGRPLAKPTAPSERPMDGSSQPTTQATPDGDKGAG